MYIQPIKADESTLFEKALETVRLMDEKDEALQLLEALTKVVDKTQVIVVKC